MVRSLFKPMATILRLIYRILRFKFLFLFNYNTNIHIISQKPKPF